MQSVWARLLAGEVTKPGSFSQRTLQVLRNLSAHEAQQFNQLCKVSFRGLLRKEVFPLFFEAHRDYWNSIGINFLALQNLESAGLLTYHPFGVSRTGKNGFTLFFRGTDQSIFIESTGENVSVGKVVLTAVGLELAEICEWHIPTERVDAVLNVLPNNFRIQTGRIRDLNLDIGQGNWEITNERPAAPSPGNS